MNRALDRFVLFWLTMCLAICLAMLGHAAFAQGTGTWLDPSRNLCPLSYQVIKGIALTCKPGECETSCAKDRDWYLVRGFECVDRPKEDAPAWHCPSRQKEN